MSPKLKVVLYNFLGFAPLYLLAFFLLMYLELVDRFWATFIAAIFAFIFAPKFQRDYNNNHIYMNWIFIKGIRRVR